MNKLNVSVIVLAEAALVGLLALSPTEVNAQATGVPNGQIVTASVGGGALLAGACATQTFTLAGLTTSQLLVVSPNTYPGDGTDWQAYVSATNTGTLKVCALVAVTPTSSTYNIRIIP